MLLTFLIKTFKLVLTSSYLKGLGVLEEVLCKMELCISELNIWMCSNKLMLNINKTKVCFCFCFFCFVLFYSVVVVVVVAVVLSPAYCKHCVPTAQLNLKLLIVL